MGKYCKLTKYRLFTTINLLTRDLKKQKQSHGSKMTMEDIPPGARPTNDISIEFEIRPKFAVL